MDILKERPVMRRIKEIRENIRVRVEEIRRKGLLEGLRR